jgi:hypothetical protein
MGVDRARMQMAGGIGYCAIIGRPASGPALLAGKGEGVDGKPARVRRARLLLSIANCWRLGCIAPLPPRFDADDGGVPATMAWTGAATRAGPSPAMTRRGLARAPWWRGSRA